jgi:hypothetical protein
VHGASLPRAPIEASSLRLPWAHHRKICFTGEEEFKMANYEVIVGNIGKVYEGGFYQSALDDFTVYKNQSIKGIGRAAGESVTLMKDGEILQEYSAEEGEYVTLENGITVGLNQPQEEQKPEVDAYTGEPFTKREQALIDLLWDYLKKDPEHKDRRQTGIGTKTKRGVVASIDHINKEN